MTRPPRDPATTSVIDVPAACDVLVAGSGMAGLVAAIRAARAGADVLLIDSAEHWGGTTALSGGRVWLPCNGSGENTGDSRARALEYLRQVFDTEHEQHLEAFVDTVHDAAAFIEAHTPHRFIVCPNYPDYHPGLEGATLGGRCYDVGLYHLSDMTPESARVRRAPSYVPITHAEWESWRTPDRFDGELIQGRLDGGIVTGGPGLVAALIDGAIRAGVQLRRVTTLEDVVVGADGVTSALVRDSRGQHTISTTAVVVAAGGYDADPAARNELMPRALALSGSAPTNTGIALSLAYRHGLAVSNLGNGWWMPMVQLPGESLDGAPYPRALIRERGAPRLIVVNGAGERCLNEALPYNEFGKALHATAPDGSVPNLRTWVVVDECFRRSYPLPGLTNVERPPATVLSADTVAGLAVQMGVPAHALERTIADWNAACRTGIDADFAKGESAYDRYYGDPFSDRHPNLGPLDTPPYYATRVFSGSIGSKGGPVTSIDGLAVRKDGSAVKGLYVAGTAAAFWTSDGYPGPGTPLAISLAFGYRAAGHAVEHRLKGGAA